MSKKKKHNVQIFKLEERVLFDGAAAAEIVAAVNNAGNDAQADQDSDDNSQDKEEKLIQNTVQNAGPVDTPAPEANVQNDGEGLPQADAAQNDPADVLIQGNADFSQVADAAADFSGDVADLIQNASSSDADTHDLYVIDPEAADQFDAADLDGKNVLILDADSDAAEQIENWMNEHSGQDIDSVHLVTDSDTLASQLGGMDADVISVEAFQAELDDVSGDMVVIPDHGTSITVETQDTILPEELTQDAEADRHELVIINSSIADIDNVLEQLGNSREVLVIDVNSDAFEQISEYLNNSDTAYDAVHIITHGSSSGFSLGYQEVSSAEQMAVFDGHMAEHGDFLIYGCNLASSEQGQALIHNIADLTGCDVAASTNTTGAASRGGDWTLEYSTGLIETASVSLDSSWDNRLQTLTVDSEVTASSGTTYKTFKEAFLAAGNGDEIKILQVKDDSGYNPLTPININLHIYAKYRHEDDASTHFTWQVGNVTVAAGKTLTIDDIGLTHDPDTDTSFIVNGNLVIDSQSANIIVDVASGGQLTVGKSAHITTVNAVAGANLSLSASGSTIDTLNIGTGWSGTLSKGTIGTLNNNGTVTASGASFTTIYNSSVLNFNAGTAGSLNHTGSGLSISGGSISNLISHEDASMSGGTVSAASVSGLSSTFSMTSGNIVTLTANSTTVDISGSSVIGNLESTNTALSISNGSVTGTLTHNSGTLTISGGSFNNVYNASYDANTISGTSTAIDGTLTNAGSLSVSDGTVNRVVNTEGTLTFTGGTVTGTVSNAAALLFNADISTGKIKNTGTLEINNCTLSIATGNSELAIDNQQTAASIVFNNGRLLNSTPTAGTGISNITGGSVTASASTATIEGFSFATRVVNGETISFTSVGNTYIAQDSLVVRGNNLAIVGFVSLDDALDYIISDSANAYSININLALQVAGDDHEYDNWSKYLTISGNYAYPISNLYDIVSATVIDKTLVNQNIIINTDLALAPASNNGYIGLDNISVTVNADKYLVIQTGSNLKMIGTAPKIVSVSGLDTPFPTAVLEAGHSQVVNNGHFSVYGGLEAFYEDISARVQSVANYGEMTLQNAHYWLGVTVSASVPPEIVGIYNEGTLTIEGAELFTGTLDTAGNFQKSALPSGVGIVSMIRSSQGTVTVTDSTLDVRSSSSFRTFAVYNDAGLTITDSFIDASGSASYGLFNGVNGNAQFKVTKLPDIDLSPFSGSDGSVTVREYLDQVYHIKGDDYSVYNEGNFATDAKDVPSGSGYTISGGLLSGSLTGTYGTVTFRDAPLYGLIGDVAVQGISDDVVYTYLTDITLQGNLGSLGTAKVYLTNLVINGVPGDPLRQVYLYNTLSEVYVAGSFRSSNFVVGGYKGYFGSGGKYGTISVVNNPGSTEGSRKGGSIYFGQSAASKVIFGSELEYAFYNLSGEMLFDYFGGLSSEDHPVQFYNQGVLTIDGTHADGKTDEGLYRLYVTEAMLAVARLSSFHDGLVSFPNPPRSGDDPTVRVDGISNMGIVNQNLNFHNIASPISNQLTLRALDVRNTQNSAAAVSNYAGNVTVDGSRLSATYSALDNIAVYDVIHKDSDTHGDFYVTVGIVNFINAVEVAGGAYSVRNDGELTVTGNAAQYTLFTNKLDFSTDYTGGYTAVMNNSISVSLTENDSTDTGVYTIVYFGWNSGFSHGHYSFKSGTEGPYLASSNLYRMTSASTVARTEIAMEPAKSKGRSEDKLTEYSYGVILASEAVAKLDYVSFLAQSTPAVNTVFSNWGDLTVTHIDKGNQFNGFNYAIDISTSYFATKAATGIWDFYSLLVSTNALETSKTDIEVGFDVAAASVMSGVNKWILTMRGVETGDNLYKGGFTVDGSALSVSQYGELFLINFSVDARNSANAIQVDVGGLLHIYNGVYDDKTHQWIGGSNAVITSDGNANGVMLYGTMEMFNGAITECVNGIVAADTVSTIGMLLVVNSTIAGNSGWGIISDIFDPGSTNLHNLVVADSTIAYNGQGGIQVNNGGKLSMLNSIVLNRNTSGTASVDVVLNDGSTMAEGFEGNVYGSSASDTDVKMNAVFGSLNLTWTGPDMYTISQVKGNAYAWNASIAWSFDASSSSRLLFNEIFLGSGGQYSITYDKMGNARQVSGDRIGSYVLSGSVGPTLLLVNTRQDSNDIIYAGSTKLYSLRYVINYLLSENNTSENTVVGFDWDALYAEASSKAITLTLDNALGSLNLTYVSGTTLIDTLTIDLLAPEHEIPSGYTLTVDGSALNTSMFTVSGIALIVNGADALTVNGANAAGAGITADGAAFNLADVAGTSLELTDVTVTKGYTIGNGGAVYVAGPNASLTVSGTTFDSNNADTDGGAVYNNGGTVTASGTTFSKNYAYSNGGAVYNNGGTVTVSDSVFSGNDVGGNGGAIFNKAALTVTQSTFDQNTAIYSGGAVYSQADMVLDATFTSNIAVRGGAIYNAAGNAVITGSLSANRAQNGGAIYNDAPGTLSLTGNLTNNIATSANGGGLYNLGKAVIIGTVDSNHAMADGAGIYNKGSLTLTGDLSNNIATGNGGGLYNDNAGFETVITGNVTGNSAATDGAGIYSESGSVKLTGNLMNNSGPASSFAVYVAAGTFDMVGDIKGNNAGGVIATVNGLIQLGDLDHYISISENTGFLTFENPGSGDILIVNAAIRNNDAGSGTLFIVDGGRLTLVNSTVTANTGDILEQSAGMVQIADSTIAFNNGSQILLTGGSLYAVNSIVNAANTFTLTGQVATLINIDEALVFSMKNGQPIDGPNGTLVIKLSGPAGNGGVMAGYTHTAAGTSVYYTADGSNWYDVYGSAVTVPGMTVVGTSENGAVRLYQGYGLLSIGAYSLKGDALSLVVTISGDETQEGETTLRDALDYAEYLFVTTGAVQTVTFEVTDVYLNSSITIRNSAVVNGNGKVTIHAADLGSSSLFSGDSVFIVDGFSDVTFKGVAVIGKAGVRGYRVDAANLTLDNTAVWNGQADGSVPGSQARGGAVYVKSGSSLTGNNVDLSDNYAVDGGAIYSEGQVTLNGFTISGNQTSNSAGATIQMADPSGSSVLFLQNGDLFDNWSAGNLISTQGTAELISVAAYDNALGSSLLTAKSADVVNSTLTGDPADGAPLVKILNDLNVANSIIVTSDRSGTAVSAAAVSSAYSIYSGSLTNVYVDVQNLQGLGYWDVFPDGGLVPNEHSPAAVGVWTTYDPVTRTIAYSERPEGIWTVKYAPENMAWRYLGGGVASYQPNLLVGSDSMPSIGRNWSMGSWNHPDYGPGVNTSLINPSYNGLLVSDWGYNSVVNGYLMNPASTLSGPDESGMGWYAALLSELFGFKAQQTSVLSVTGMPMEELDLSVDASTEDFEEFQEAPYHVEDGSPLSEQELTAIRKAAVAGRVPEESVPLDDSVHRQVASSLRSAELFKDGFDKALDALLGLDA